MQLKIKNYQLEDFINIMLTNNYKILIENSGDDVVVLVRILENIEILEEEKK